LSSKVDSEPNKDEFIRNEKGEILPVIENFYRYCGQKKLMCVRCVNCDALIFPPRGICPKCLQNRFEWIRLQGVGNLLTYTVIHFPPTQFDALAPYAVGVAKLVEGPQVPGMIKHAKLEDLRIGMALKVEFESGMLKEWPRWPRYFFTTAD